MGRRGPARDTGCAASRTSCQRSDRGKHPTRALAEGDGAAVGPGGGGPHADLVTVPEEGELAAVLERHRLRAAPTDLEEGPALEAFATGDGAAGEEVPGPQPGAVDGHVGEHLGGGPIRL